MLDSAEMRCVLEVLKILAKGISNYSFMFKETKSSHTTLQNVLKDLVKEKFVKKNIRDKLHTSYDITDKGKKLLRGLENLNGILR